jgi:hypothetical protein
MNIRGVAIAMRIALAAAASSPSQAITQQEHDGSDPFGVRLTATLWGGYTTIAGAGGPATGGREDSWGIRLAEVAVWPTERLRLSAQYDNGLSQDESARLRAEPSAPAVYVGGMLGWGGRFLTRLEGGWRDQTHEASQRLIRGEQVVFLPSGVVAKAGGWVGLRPDTPDEWVAHLGVGWIPASGLLIEPVVFLARDERSGDRQQRLLVYGQHQPRAGWEIGTGVVYGSLERGGGAKRTPLWEAFVKAGAPVVAGQRMQALIRHERIDGQQNTTVLAVGLTLGSVRR